jgi:hypothetical protein
LLFLAEYFVHTQKRYWNFENCFFWRISLTNYKFSFATNFHNLKKLVFRLFLRSKAPFLAELFFAHEIFFWKFELLLLTHFSWPTTNFHLQLIFGTLKSSVFRLFLRSKTHKSFVFHLFFEV